MSNTASDARKLKNTLTKLKSHISSLPSSSETKTTISQTQTKHLHNLLIYVEILQRGIIPSFTLSYNDDDDDDDEKEQQQQQQQQQRDLILTLVHSTCGKPLLSSSSSGYPTPLLSGLFALSGLIAEKCYHAAVTIESSSDTTTTTSTPSSSSSEIVTLRQRCHDVNDHRFLTLLVPLLPSSTTLSFVTLHYYHVAARLTMDQPPTWKKLYETCRDITSLTKPVEQTTTRMMMESLEQLRRITLQKKNIKKYIEWSITLVDCLVTASSSSESAATTTTVPGFEPTLTNSTTSPARRARHVLSEIESSPFPNEVIRRRYLTLALGSALALEREEWDRLVEEEIVKRERRSSSKETTSSSSSLEEGTRRTMLIDVLKNEDDDDEVDKAGEVLWSHVVEEMTMETTTTTTTDFDGYRYLTEFISRLVEKGWILATTGDAEPLWRRCHDKCRGLLTEDAPTLLVKSDSDNNNDETNDLQKLLETCAMTIATVQWMSSSITPSSSLRDTSLSILRHSHSNKTTTTKPGINETTPTPSPQDNALAAAYYALASLSHLSSPPPPPSSSSSESQQQISTMTHSWQSTPQDHHYGTSYLLCLASWDGPRRHYWNHSKTRVAARELVAMARETLELSQNKGRVEIKEEECWLSLADGDACVMPEGGPGATIAEGVRCYQSVIDRLSDDGGDGGDSRRRLPLAHAHLGLSHARLIQRDPPSAEHHARLSLSLLSSSPCLFSGAIFQPATLCHSHALSRSHHALAQSLLHSPHPQRALDYLEEAFKNDPNDYHVLVALGAHHVRFSSTKKDAKLARKLLLTSVSLHPRPSDALSLLGISYECGSPSPSETDLKRAEGCYKKALECDATHPVAGRGVIRLSQHPEAYCERAVRLSSPTNGWAYWYLGKVCDEDDEEEEERSCWLLQEALRKRDVLAGRWEPLGAFFSPRREQEEEEESGEVWALLARRYRELGKFTASARAYERSMECFGGDVGSMPMEVLGAWALVEWELGLPDESFQKFKHILSRPPTSSSSHNLLLAAYGYAISALRITHRYIQEGKFGLSQRLLTDAARTLERYLDKQRFFATDVLLGDLYTCHYYIPHHLYRNDGVREMLKKGERAYRSALQLVQDRNDEDDENHKPTLIAAAAYNVGHVLYLQSTTTTATPDNKSLLSEATSHFRLSLRHHPQSPHAWIGLGCVYAILPDYLLSQHCFLRAVAVTDHAASGGVPLPDAPSNLAALYLSKDLTESGERFLELLAQVGDTPLMWILRGGVLELRLGGDSERTTMTTTTAIVDAYRASLEVSRHSEGFKGLARSLDRRRMVMESKQQQQQQHRIRDDVESDACFAIYEFQTSGRGGGQGGSDIAMITTREETKDNDDTTTTTTTTMTNDDNNDTQQMNNVSLLEQTKRAVHLNPHVGSFWINYAKSLLATANDNSANDDYYRLLMTKAAKAAKIGADLMSRRVLSPSSSALSSSSRVGQQQQQQQQRRNDYETRSLEEIRTEDVDIDLHPSVVAEAMALVFWLYHEMRNDIEMTTIDDDGDDTAAAGLVTNENNIETQEEKSGETDDDDGDQSSDIETMTTVVMLSKEECLVYLQKALLLDPCNELARAGLQKCSSGFADDDDNIGEV